jgi:hypothetical protein
VPAQLAPYCFVLSAGVAQAAGILSVLRWLCPHCVYHAAWFLLLCGLCPVHHQVELTGHVNWHNVVLGGCGTVNWAASLVK